MNATASPWFPSRQRELMRARICALPKGLEGPADLRGAWVFGAGEFGRFIVAYLRANGAEPGGFLDNGNSVQGELRMGLRVLSPDSDQVPRSSWVIVAVKGAAPEVEEQCRHLGFNRILRGWEAVHAWAATTRVPAYVSSKEAFLARWEEYESAIPLLADPTSRRILKKAIQYRITCRDEDLPPFDPDEYFRPSLPPAIAFEEVVDCGAFDGDTLQSLLDRHPGCFRAYHAFEPDPSNFQRLKNRLATLPAGIASRVRAYPFATGSRDGEVRFEGGCGLGSALQEDGSLVAEVVSLDRILKGCRPTFIKMDIEGAELEALAGAEGLIRRWLPLLAVCIYHRPEHYVAIPRWIHGLDLGYRLELRHHSRYFTGTVCYATPPAFGGRRA